jgi:hypothetical protein
MPGYLTQRDYKDGSVSPGKQGVSVYNDSGVALTPGKLVYVSGWATTPAGAGDYIRAVKQAGADALIPACRAEYVVLERIPVGSYGRVAKAGAVRDLNTNGVTTAGDPVYLDTTIGGFTATAPTGSTANVQIVGYAVTKSATAGIVRFDLTREPVTLGGQGILANSIGGVKLASVTPLAAAGALGNVNMGVEGVLILDIPDAASGNVDFTSLPFKIQVLGGSYIKTGGAGNAGNSMVVHNGTTGNAITGSLNSATDKDVVAITSLDDAYWEIAANATVRVVTVKAGGNNAARLVLRYVRVA